MKMKSLSKLFLVLTIVASGLNTVKAQSSLQEDKAMKADEVDSLLKSKNYVFEATHTKSDSLHYHKYAVAVSKDTLVAYLPGTTGNDTTKVSCTSFAYHVVKNEKGDWDVYIIPNSSMSDVKQLTLYITPTGHASLRVLRTDAKPLLLDGYIKQEDY
jgi:hypothetical protein